MFEFKYYCRLLEVIVFLITISASSIVFAEEDRLVPCYSALMGNEIISRYYMELNARLLSSDSKISDGKSVVRVVRISTSDAESSMSLYEDNNNKYELEYLEANRSIWDSLLADNVIQDKDVTVNGKEFGGIDVRISRVEISSRLFNTLYKVWSQAINQIKMPNDNFINVGLDGTTYFFSSNISTCGLAPPAPKGENIDKLIRLSEDLMALAKSGTQSKDFEQKVLSEAKLLLNNLCMNDPHSPFCRIQSGTDHD